MSGDSPAARRPVDLRRLPTWAQYALSLTVVAAVVALAWITGRGQPVPDWVTAYLIPALGWLYVGLLIFAVARWLARARRH